MTLLRSKGAKEAVDIPKKVSVVGEVGLGRALGGNRQLLRICEISLIKKNRTYMMHVTYYYWFILFKFLCA